MILIWTKTKRKAHTPYYDLQLARQMKMTCDRTNRTLTDPKIFDKSDYARRAQYWNTSTGLAKQSFRLVKTVWNNG